MSSASRMALVSAYKVLPTTQQRVFVFHDNEHT